MGSGRQKKNHQWHYQHMEDPRRVVDGSNMPAFPHLLRDKIDPQLAVSKIKTMRALGVPYSKEEIAKAAETLEAQAKKLRDELVLQLKQGVETAKVEVGWDDEIVALIAYLQRLGNNKIPVQQVAGGN